MPPRGTAWPRSASRPSSWWGSTTSGTSTRTALMRSPPFPEHGWSSSPESPTCHTSRGTRRPSRRSRRSSADLSAPSPAYGRHPARAGLARHPLTIRPVRRRRRYGVLRHVTQTPALLVLEDGRTFRGESFGAAGETFGEAVFATGMTGYQETLTDPSYHRQVVVMTAPHVGNTGMNDEDPESSRIWVSGYVVRDPARIPSNWRSQRTLDDAL